MSRRIGIYGGFFNPLHDGHIHVIKTCIENLNLGKLIVLPTYQNPIKENLGQDSAYSKIFSLRPKINEHLVKVSDFE